jgi:hypothetical protein
MKVGTQLLCYAGFGPDGRGGCMPTCGDGRSLLSEECDDGNVADGDGQVHNLLHAQSPDMTQNAQICP